MKDITDRQILRQIQYQIRQGLKELHHLETSIASIDDMAEEVCLRLNEKEQTNDNTSTD